MSRGALSGLRVVEFGNFAAGPHVGKHLADHGAQVIHVESRQRMDGFRTNYPPFKDGVPGPERAAMFAMTHNDKLGVTLNLKTEEAVRLARRLIRCSDAVIENFTPGTMARLGLGYESLREEHPGLIMLSTCNQGQTGPHARHPGFGTHLTAMSGFINLTGWPDRDPSLLWGPYIDYIAVAYGVIVLLAALDERRRTGRGCHIDLSQYETGLQFVAPLLVEYQRTGLLRQRDGNRDPQAVPHGIYPCLGEERWCAISVHDDREWERLRQALGRPRWAAPGMGFQQRRAAEAAIDRGLAGWTSRRSRDEVVDRLRRARVHVAPVNDMRDLFLDPQLARRRVWRRLDHPVIGSHLAVGPPFELSETPARIERPAFLLGQHNREVFCGLLQLTEEEYLARERAGVFD